MGNTTARSHALYRSLCKKDSEVKVNKVPDEVVDDVFEEDTKRGCCPWRSGPAFSQANHRVDLVLSFLYGTTIIGGVFVVALVPLVQLFKSPRMWCRDPLRTQDSSAEFCWLDLVQRTFPVTVTDVIAYCAGLASFVLGCLWFCCKSWRGRRHMWVVSLLLVIVFLTEVITSIAIAIIYSQRQAYLPIELRKTIKEELYQTVRTYDSDANIKNTWDLVQQSWCCCGVMEAVDWRNYGKWNKIPRSCAVLDRSGKGYACFGYPWTHTITVDHPKYFEEERLYTTSRGCFELFARKVGEDYVAAINVGWKVLLTLSFLQLFGIIAPVVHACWGNPSDPDRDITVSVATEMTSARSMSTDSTLSQNNRMSRQMSRQPSQQMSRQPSQQMSQQPSRQMSRQPSQPVSQPTGGASLLDNSVQRQESRQMPTAPPKGAKSDLVLRVC